MSPFNLLWSLLFFGVGTWCFQSDDLFVNVLGGMLWLLGWVVVVWVIVSDMSEKRARYWDSVGDAINAANKSDLDKLAALGFSSQSILQKMSVELTDTRAGLNNTQYFELPVSPVKLQPLARAVLNGQPFTERRWADMFTSTEFRTLRGVMRDKGLIIPVSESDPRQGYTFTPAGIEVLEGIAGTN